MANKFNRPWGANSLNAAAADRKHQSPDWRAALNRILHILCLPALVFTLALDSLKAAEMPEKWLVSLDTPGGPLQFPLTIQPDKRTAVIASGDAQVRADVSIQTDSLEILLPHFDSKIELENVADGWTGTWRKTRGAQQIAELKCQAIRWHQRPSEDPTDFLGRWEVQFSESNDPAVGVFRRFGETNQVIGTFLTTTGDYRYLAGRVVAGNLELSCFDGGHAFLFRAALADTGQLKGDFWSGNWHHETWTAHQNPDVQLPDGFLQTELNENHKLSQLRFPDASGKVWSLDDSALLGRVTLIEVFGTWCPNCHDEAAYLQQLQSRYGKQGLKVVGLAFELTGDFERDARQVARYRERFQIEYPLLIAGVADKELASKQLPLIDRLRSYPTTLFVDGGGNVRAVYTGFSGPATGEAYRELQSKFEAIIERLLSQ